MGKEVRCLSCAGARIRMSEVVPAADEASVSSSSVLTREVRRNVRGTLGGLLCDVSIVLGRHFSLLFFQKPLTIKG